MCGQIRPERSRTKAGYKVVLTGEGPDEIFAEYPAFVIDAVRHGSEAEQNALRQAADGTDMSRVLQKDGSTERQSFLSRLGYACLV